MMNEEQINESVMKTIRFRMVSEIVKIIQSEVDRTSEK